MTIERMLTEEQPAGDLVGARAAGSRHRDGVRHLRRPYRPDRLGACSKIPELGPHRAGARGIARRRHGRGLRPADAAAGRADRAGALGARQRPDRHDGGLPVELADAAADRFLRLRTPFHLHAPYQQATGDYGSWDARRAFSGVTKHVMQAHDAGRRGAGDAACDQACARRAAGPGRRAVQPWTRWPARWRRTRSRCCTRPATICPPPPPPADARACRGRRAGAAGGAEAGDDRRQRRAHRAGLRRAAPAWPRRPGCRW